MGDLNARAGIADDFLVNSKYDNCQPDDEPEMLTLSSLNIQEKRVSVDKVVNEGLLELCKSANMYIVNGRFDNDVLQGKAACDNVSVVDYVIFSPSIFSYINSFILQYYDPMLSDIHCAVNTTFKYKESIAIVQNSDHVTQPSDCAARLQPIKPKWKQEFIAEFKQSLDDIDISDIMAELHNISRNNDGVIDQSSVNKVVDEINSVFHTTSRGLNMLASTSEHSGHKKPRARKHAHQVWYNDACEVSRRDYVKFKNKYRELQSNKNLNILRKSGRKDKKEINKAFKTYKQKIINKIRVLKTTSPREYWNLINDRKSQKTFNDISLEVFHDHFRKMNQAERDETEINIPEENLDPLFNDHVTTDEMFKLVRTLKNNKSSGNDQVLNHCTKTQARRIILTIIGV